ncbi:hypothetical protein M0R45_016077 [Rubus argutus]|uniref:Uncharacterized protein n=1 Tax=Rubus argutus TaxID=59490 RepID=A0AAW1XSM8_RUBAR
MVGEELVAASKVIRDDGGSFFGGAGATYGGGSDGLGVDHGLDGRAGDDEDSSCEGARVGRGELVSARAWEAGGDRDRRWLRFGSDLEMKDLGCRDGGAQGLGTSLMDFVSEYPDHAVIPCPVHHHQAYLGAPLPLLCRPLQSAPPVLFLELTRASPAVSPLAQPDSFSALIHRRAQPRVASAFTALPPKLLPKATTPTSLHLHFHDRSN